MSNLKTILNKIKINNVTYFFIISALITGMINELKIISLIIIVHELGHLFIIKVLRYKVSYIEFLPFGGRIHIDKNINSKLFHDFLIAIFGLLFQIILYYIISYLYIKGYIRDLIFTYFKSYNKAIFIFNLLPIIPLDGYYILKSIVEYFFSVKKAFIIVSIFSFLLLMLFFYINLYYKLNNFIIIVFLIYKFIDEVCNYKYIYHRFMLERYLNNYNFKRKTIIQKIDQMFKEKKHYLIKENKLIKEQEFLEDWFDKRY